MTSTWRTLAALPLLFFLRFPLDSSTRFRCGCVELLVALKTTKLVVFFRNTKLVVGLEEAPFTSLNYCPIFLAQLQNWVSVILELTKMFVLDGGFD
jgi:hypothetical protein